MRDICGAKRRIVGWAFFLAICGAVALLAKGLYPADLPESPNPDFIDNVFDNRGVLWAARLLLVSAAGVLAFGGIFIVVSIGIRMRNREWLRRAGPFEISEGEASVAEGDAEFWCEAAVAAEKDAARLREHVSRLEELIVDFRNG